LKTGLLRFSRQDSENLRTLLQKYENLESWLLRGEQSGRKNMKLALMSLVVGSDELSSQKQELDSESSSSALKILNLTTERCGS